ncbi:MAG: hypothetical protein R3F53_19495 [Gammaproteobacteria bacterium]
MAVRAAGYTGLLYQILSYQSAGPQGQLRRYCPMVIYNGEPRWTAAVEQRTDHRRSTSRWQHFNRASAIVLDVGAASRWSATAA